MIWDIVVVAIITAITVIAIQVIQVLILMVDPIIVAVGNKNMVDMEQII